MTLSGLHGRRMRVASTDPDGVVSAETVLEFTQTGDVVSARYSGGAIVDGHLIGRLDPSGTLLHFCYVQVDLRGNVDAGTSIGTIGRMQDGRLRLTEEFQWFGVLFGKSPKREGFGFKPNHVGKKIKLSQQLPDGLGVIGARVCRRSQRRGQAESKKRMSLPATPILLVLQRTLCLL
jgi:hypothetical protein